MRSERACGRAQKTNRGERWGYNGVDGLEGIDVIGRDWKRERKEEEREKKKNI